MCASPSSLSPLETPSPTSSPLLTIETINEGELPQNQKVTLLSTSSLPSTKQTIHTLFQESAHLSQDLPPVDSSVHQFKPLAESNSESLSSLNSKDFSNFIAPNTSMGSESASSENSVFPSETNTKRSSSVELEPNQQQQITNLLIRHAGSLSDRSPTEIQSVPLISRLVSITASLPTPKLIKLLSGLKKKEIEHWKRSYFKEHQQQGHEIKQIFEGQVILSSQEKKETVLKGSPSHSSNQAEKSPLTLDVKTEASIDSKEETETTLSARQEQPSPSNEFINTLSKQTPQEISQFFNDLFTTIQSCTKTNQQTLAEIFTEVILNLESHQLLQQESLLKRIGSLYLELYILVHTQLEKAYATELVHMILTKKSPNIVYSHHWFTPTNTFAQALHTRLSDCQDREQISLLSNTVKLLLNMRTFHPLSVSMIASFDTLASQRLEHNECKDIFANLKTCCWFSLRNLLPNSRSNRTISHKQTPHVKSTSTKRNWLEIDELIRNNKVVDTETVKRLAWDLKILDVYFFNKIGPEEFVNLAWTHKQSRKAPHLKTSISYFDALSNLAQTHILTSNDPKLRAHYCEFFIQLSKQLIEIGSLNNAYSLLTALNSSPINRLKQTWSEVKSDCLTIKDQLDLLFSTEKNSQKYWTHIQNYLNLNTASSETCLVPAVSLSLAKLTFITDLRTILTEESTDVVEEKGCLNSTKILLLSEQCRVLQRLTSCTRQFSHEFLLDRLLFANLLNQLEEIKKSVEKKTISKFEDELWSLSKNYEETPQKTNQKGQKELKKRHSTGSLRTILRDKNKQAE